MDNMIFVSEKFDSQPQAKTLIWFLENSWYCRFVFLWQLASLKEQHESNMLLVNGYWTLKPFIFP